MAKLDREKGGELGSATACYGTGFEARHLSKFMNGPHKKWSDQTHSSRKKTTKKTRALALSEQHLNAKQPVLCSFV